MTRFFSFFFFFFFFSHRFSVLVLFAAVVVQEDDSADVTSVPFNSSPSTQGRGRKESAAVSSSMAATAIPESDEPGGAVEVPTTQEEESDTGRQHWGGDAGQHARSALPQSPLAYSCFGSACVDRASLTGPTSSKKRAHQLHSAFAAPFRHLQLPTLAQCPAIGLSWLPFFCPRSVFSVPAYTFDCSIVTDSCGLVYQIMIFLNCSNLHL